MKEFLILLAIALFGFAAQADFLSGISDSLDAVSNKVEEIDNADPIRDIHKKSEDTINDAKPIKAIKEAKRKVKVRNLASITKASNAAEQANLMKQIKTKPYRAGLSKVTWIKKDSIWEKRGFKVGDIVRLPASN